LEAPPDLEYHRSDKPEKDLDQEIDNREKNWLSWIRIGLTVFVAVMTVAIIAIFLFHLIAPGAWRWLTPDDINTIKGLAITLVVGLVMSGVTAYFFKRKG